MTDQEQFSMSERIRATYNVPDETPREAMWAVIAARMDGQRTDVLDLDAARERATARRSVGSARPAGWAVAAAAVLVLGIGIGRMTAPIEPGEVAPATGATVQGRALTLAAQDYLGQTESLLTMVRADGRDGRVDPSTARWAEGLLAQTRLLLDAQQNMDPQVERLLLDLELVLVQIAGVGETGSMEEGRARTELDLAIRSLEDGEVLPRIQAVLPPQMAGA